MDYIEAFKNLKTNNKYSRKSPHKAILLLTVIEMYENGLIPKNEIRYDDALNNTFLQVWNRTLPEESLFFPDAYLPFWYLQSDKFWHIVPLRGNEDVIEVMRDERIKPSEAKIKNYVDYAELDDDLFFLMTLPSSRALLKRSLLETYSALSDCAIDKMCSTTDIVEDSSSSAISEYEQMLSYSKEPTTYNTSKAGNELENRFYSLHEDLQIALNYEYFSFLKNNRYERELFKEECPTVFHLYDHITIHPLAKAELSPSFAFTYENFLCDLKISLMSEDNAVDLIDSISNAIDILRGEYVEVKAEEENEQTPLANSPSDFYLDSHITYEHPKEECDIYAENKDGIATIYNLRGDELFSVKGLVKVLNGKPYRFNYKPMCLTIKGINQVDGHWEKGGKLIVAYQGSDLFEIIDESDLMVYVDDIEITNQFETNKLKYNGIWYSYDGKALGKELEYITPEELESEESFNYLPKGKLKKIDDVAVCSYDYLWLMAITDFMGEKTSALRLNFDTLACMMIANAWEILSEKEELREKENSLCECIEYLIEESKEYMEVSLDWNSSKEEVYEVIKDYPMGGVFEDTVDELLSKSPYNVLRAWLKFTDEQTFIHDSINFANSCLYALHLRKIDSYIEINPSWKNSLYHEHSNLIRYFKIHYCEYLRK